MLRPHLVIRLARARSEVSSNLKPHSIQVMSSLKNVSSHPGSEFLGTKHFASNSSPIPGVLSYEETIQALNRLQSNKSVPHNASASPPPQSKNLSESLKYLTRCGVDLEDFESQVPVIHVSGTKGKGSTCSLCESILRAHGYRTGLYTSPHLLSVRERIKINGVSLSASQFTKYFWEIYHRLYNNKEHETDMPMYFKFLTVMAFYVFMAEKVDVAIIEVGIGGEQDCTNILRKTPVVGITSLGLDHTLVLGDTIEKIAWEKAGIIKPGSRVFTVPTHQYSALVVLKERAKENGVELRVVPEIDAYDVDSSNWQFTHRLNASLAVQLAHSWMGWRNNIPQNGMRSHIDDTTLRGIVECSWLGRFQTVERGHHKFYLDGAHTEESTQLCANWFNMTAPKEGKRILVFNTTQGRSPHILLKAFLNSSIDVALFCSNILRSESRKIPQDIINQRVTATDVVKVTGDNLTAWRDLCGSGDGQSRGFSTVEDTLEFVDSIDTPCHVLVTGSIHLVGAVLTLLQEESS